MPLKLIDADQVCTAVAASVLEHLPAVITAAGLNASQWKPPRDFKQVPTADALGKIAAWPAGASACPGLLEPPTRTVDGWRATWRVFLAVYDRGGDYTATAARVRKWAALVRAAALHDPTLGGVARSVTWADESYLLRTAAGEARTIGGATVALNIQVSDAVDATDLTADPLPTVTTTSTSVAVRVR
ncbi:hypothetical protein [Nocardioides sp. GY 10127]|uniref:hypothetical protein n=1 Tax=Nocardioides sp. GY 10127 TaxID=2569762 RepID=UPI0010A7862F|nr:hypothetical protein [Nocardioides sp. GY 10127]TIC78779.1 hypothetical protein E8D37_18970 [Nocardioides sp. GY 10127]